jgi:hypothetical protein
MKRERYFSVLVLVFCALWLINTPSIPSATMPGAPGPRFFPYLVIGVLSGLCILQFILSYRKISSKSDEKSVPIKPLPIPEDEEPVEGEGCIDPDDLEPDRKSLFSAFILIVLYVVGIDVVGFYPATIPAVFLSLFIASKRKKSWFKLLPGTAFICLGVYGVFTLALHIPLPAGRIW